MQYLLQDINAGATKIGAFEIPFYDVFAGDRNYLRITSGDAAFEVVSYEFTATTAGGKQYKKSVPFLSIPLRTFDEKYIDVSDVIAAACAEKYGKVDIVLLYAVKVSVKYNGATYTSTRNTWDARIVAGGTSPFGERLAYGFLDVFNNYIVQMPPQRLLCSDYFLPNSPILINDTIKNPTIKLLLQINSKDVDMPSPQGLHYIFANEYTEEGTGYDIVLFRRIGANLQPLWTDRRDYQLADTCREHCKVEWVTRWGVKFSAVFYLHAVSEEKKDAKQIATPLGGYADIATIVHTGTIYIDNIAADYDAWWYMSLLTARSVSLETAAQKHWQAYLPIEGDHFNSTYNNVKITGSDMKEVIFGGINSRTISFTFEYEDTL